MKIHIFKKVQQPQQQHAQLMTSKSATITSTNQTTSMQQQTKAPMITSNSVDLGSTTRSIMKNSSLKTQQSQPSYYEATNMNLWKKQEDNPTTTTTVAVLEQSPKSTTTSSSLTSSGGTNPANTSAANAAAAAAAAASSSSSQKPKVRFNLDINYEKEREWNRVNKIIVDASKSEIEWTQEVEV